MKVDTDDLVTTKQIAEKLGVTPAAVTNWKSRHETFPDPVFEDAPAGTASRVAIYLWWQVEAWAKHYNKI